MSDVIRKAERLFEVSPWLKENKNIMHLPIADPNSKTKPPEPMAGISWREFYILIRSI